MVEGEGMKVEKSDGDDHDEVLQQMLEAGANQFSLPSTTVSSTLGSGVPQCGTIIY